jgi:hypothetical protein
MTLKGGTVSFTDETNKQDLILEILNSESTTIKKIEVVHDAEEKSPKYIMSTGIFEIKFNRETFGQNFKNNPPNLLLIKVFKDCIDIEVNNEITIHNEIASKINMIPIAPSILFYDTITEAFYESCTPNMLRKNTDFRNIIKPSEPDPQKPLNRVHKIVVMEFIECQTYLKFVETFTSSYNYYLMIHNGVGNNMISQFYDSNKFLEFKAKGIFSFTILGINIYLTLKELGMFFTYYLASVLAVEKYHHGDLHARNVMICSNLRGSNLRGSPNKKSLQDINNLEILPVKVTPFLIDFGRAGEITNDKLKLDIVENSYLKKIGLTITDTESIQNDDSIEKSLRNSYSILRTIYLNALDKKSAIADYVKTLLDKQEYVDAILTLNMCINTTFIGNMDETIEPPPKTLGPSPAPPPPPPETLEAPLARQSLYSLFFGKQELLPPPTPPPPTPPPPDPLPPAPLPSAPPPQVFRSQFIYYMDNLAIREKSIEEKSIEEKSIEEKSIEEKSIYEYLFMFTDEIKKKFNTEIHKLIEERKKQQTASTEFKREGGKLVLRRQKNSKTRRYRRSKLHKKKSKKSMKSKKSKTKKSNKTNKSKTK